VATGQKTHNTMPFKKFRPLAAAAALLLSTQSHALVVINPCTNLTATSGVDISVNECRGTGGWVSEYQVSNRSTQTLYSLFVSTQARYPMEQLIVAQRSNWNAEYLSEEAWNTRYERTFNLSFDSAFGTEDTGAFYMLTSDMEAGITQADGMVKLASFGAQPTSNFLALGANNVVLASSFIPASNNAVPEPAGFGLAALGLLAAAAARRRKA